jgi:hypothetical protein
VGDYYQSVGSCLSHQGQMDLVSDIYKYVTILIFPSYTSLIFGSHGTSQIG